MSITKPKDLFPSHFHLEREAFLCYGSFSHIASYVGAETTIMFNIYANVIALTYAVLSTFHHLTPNPSTPSAKAPMLMIVIIKMYLSKLFIIILCLFYNILMEA